LFFSFALVFASATVAHIHSSSVRLEARYAPRQASETQRHSGSIAAPKDAVLCKCSPSAGFGLLDALIQETFYGVVAKLAAERVQAQTERMAGNGSAGCGVCIGRAG
jgi:hypothetical protein